MIRALFSLTILFFIAACIPAHTRTTAIVLPSPTGTPSPVPTALPSSTPTFPPTSTPRPTITPSPTLTPSPTFTPTLTPTVVGGGEPLIAFTAKDEQGKLNLYVDGLFTGRPKIITPISLPEEEAYYSIVKLAPDGKRLLFVNMDEYRTRWLYLFDFNTGEFQKLYNVWEGRYIHLINWSLGPDTVVLVMANVRPPGPALSYMQIDLITGNMAPPVEKRYWFDINEVTRANSPVICNDSSDRTIKRLFRAGYLDICYYPTIGLYGAWKEGENGVDFFLFAKDGQVQRTLIHFPPLVFGSWIDLLLSPDQSRLLVLGIPVRYLNDSSEGGIPFAIPISMTDSSVAAPDPETFFYSEPIYEITPPPHVLDNFYVYGWSPDSRSYLAARYYADSYNVADGTMQGEILVINSDTGETVFSYHFPEDIQPFLRGVSFSLVWPEP